MELATSPMTDRQRNYRQIYRDRIATWYNGYLHIAIIYTIGFSSLFIYTSHIQSVLWWEWITVPVVLVICNMFEWWIHAKVMHRPRKDRGSRAIYTRHTLMHHQFFTEAEPRFAGQHDWRVTVFPPYAMVVFILMSLPAALIAGWLFTANMGWLVMCTTTGIYLLYEFMHFCCHVEENWFVRHCPLVNTIRRHHIAHHNQSIMMECNMNLTFPFSDWLFGTSDLDRGLLGHLFNGYSTKYLKTNLRQTTDRAVDTATSTDRAVNTAKPTAA
ncbi:MAG: sterol desaturase family protein [Pseudomonadota bacterium]